MSETAITVTDISTASTVAVELSPRGIIELRNQQMEVIKTLMKENIHYGKVPGTPKPSLWQPGAQLLDTLHGYAPTFDLIDKVEDWDKGFFMYRYKCRLLRRRDGMLVAEGEGSCNSQQKKYRDAVYKDGTPVNPRDNANTFLKMAQKCAHISATLNATGLADIFTQDVEDMVGQFMTEVKEKEEDKKGEVICPDHGVPMRKNKWGGYSHIIEGAKTPEGKDAWHNIKADALNKTAVEKKPPVETVVEEQETPEIAPDAQIDEATIDGPDFDAALESLSKQLWGPDWQPSLRNWAKTNYGYTSRKQIKESQRAEIIKKLTAMVAAMK